MYNGNLICETFVPREPLARFADFLEFFSGAKERNLPEGGIQLVVNLRRPDPDAESAA